MRITTLALPALLIAAMLLTAAPDLSAKRPKGYVDPYKDYSEEVFMDMDFAPNIATPAVPAEIAGIVSRKVKDAASKLRNKAKIELMRNDQVFVATVPTDDLFLPNDTMLSDRADALLKPLLAPIRDPMMYKVVLAMHTDDTGSELYRDELSSARLNSVYDWMMTQVDAGTISDQLIIIPFSMGSVMPLEPNDSRTRRSHNRRLEVYYIPGPALIYAAWTDLSTRKK